MPGATAAITRRTTLRKAFLAPWDAAVQQCRLYALADAQGHTEVTSTTASPSSTPSEADADADKNDGLIAKRVP